MVQRYFAIFSRTLFKIHSYSHIHHVYVLFYNIQLTYTLIQCIFMHIHTCVRSLGLHHQNVQKEMMKHLGYVKGSKRSKVTCSVILYTYRSQTE